MFNLIISIIAIALVVVLAGASLYYGGSAFNQGSSDAKSATLINQAQQVQAAVTLYNANEGGAPDSIADLTKDSKYMAALPKMPVGGVESTWKLTDATGFDAGTKRDVVGAKFKAAKKADEGITKDICQKVNDDGAGVVFCTMSATALDAVTKGEGTSDLSAVDLAAGTGQAIVHMSI